MVRIQLGLRILNFLISIFGTRMPRKKPLIASNPRNIGRWWDSEQQKYHCVDLDKLQYLTDYIQESGDVYTNINPLTHPESIQVTENFTLQELVCRCGCGYFKYNKLFLEMYLQPFRTNFNKAMVVSSGCRCPVHNYNEGGSATSDHLTLSGVDILAITGGQRYNLIKSGIRVFDRLGVTTTFIHLGTANGRPNVPTNVLWPY